MHDGTPYGPEVRIRIGGPAGFGIKAAGQSLARMFAHDGFHCFDLTEYPSLIKGGHNTYHLRVSEREIYSHVMPTDVLVALDAATARLHADELSPHAAVIYDPADGDLDSHGLPAGICAVAVPLTKIVRDAGGIKIMRNVAALGATLGHMEYPVDGLIESLRAQFAHKAPEVAEMNIAVATAGYEHAASVKCDFPYKLTPPATKQDLVMTDGNESVGLGALAAGVGLYCAYPMTPATSVLHFMAKHGESRGVVVKHTEDEIAAMNMVVGGAFGGTRSMCATAGGGFSLMVEAFGFAGVSESACVVGLFTRPGPATGMPTWTEQSDLRFAIHASQGEFPRVVLAPGDHQQAFELTWKAFNLADVLQTPVIILGDSYLSDNRKTSAAFDTAAVTIDRGDLIDSGSVEGYERYAVTDSGISPRALPGVEGAIQLVNSYEHDALGYGAQGEIAEERAAQNEKRLRKEALARTIVPPPLRLGSDQPDVTIICFGTTVMPVRQALDWLTDEGFLVGVLQVVTVCPFPSEEITRHLSGDAHVLIVEGNATGQLEGLIREWCLIDPGSRLRRFDGRPISPEQVYQKVKQIMGEEVALSPSGALFADGRDR